MCTYKSHNLGSFIDRLLQYQTPVPDIAVIIPKVSIK